MNAVNTMTNNIRMPRLHDLDLTMGRLGVTCGSSLENCTTPHKCIRCQRSEKDDTTNNHVWNNEDDLCFECNLDLIVDTTVTESIRNVYNNGCLARSTLNGQVENIEEQSIAKSGTNAINNPDPLLIDRCQRQFPEGAISENVGLSKSISTDTRSNVSETLIFAENTVKIGESGPISTAVNVIGGSQFSGAPNVETGHTPSVKPNQSTTMSCATLKNRETGKHAEGLLTVGKKHKSIETNVEFNIGKELQDLYTVESMIGQGKFGKVYQISRKQSSSVAAAKVIPYRTQDAKQKIMKEIEIMKILNNHENVLRLIEVIDSNNCRPKNMVLITEYLSGGELFEVLAKEDLITEDEVVEIMKQILQGVAYIHSKNIIHRDLKPENVVYSSRTNGKLKIIDFGFAVQYDEKKPPKSMVGTTIFVSPEVLRFEPQSLMTDMWSIGVIAYDLLAGITPFEIPRSGDLNRTLSDQEIMENIERCLYDFNDEGLAGVSENAKTFISQLLIRTPGKRKTAEECLKHQWIENDKTDHLKPQSRTVTMKRMQNYVALKKWKKMAFAISSVTQFKSKIHV